MPFFIVPLKTLAALKKRKIDRDKYFAYIKGPGRQGILVFCPQAHEAGNDISVRVFVDYFGVPEDPATGSGNGCLAGYLVKHRYFGKDAHRHPQRAGLRDRPALAAAAASARGCRPHPHFRRRQEHHRRQGRVHMRPFCP